MRSGKPSKNGVKTFQFWPSFHSHLAYRSNTLELGLGLESGDKLKRTGLILTIFGYVGSRGPYIQLSTYVRSTDRILRRLVV